MMVFSHRKSIRLAFFVSMLTPKDKQCTVYTVQFTGQKPFLGSLIMIVCDIINVMLLILLIIEIYTLN